MAHRQRRRRPQGPSHQGVDRRRLNRSTCTSGAVQGVVHANIHGVALSLGEGSHTLLIARAWATLRVAWAVRLCFSLVRRAALVYRRAAASRSVVIVLALAAALEVSALGCCAGGLPTIAVGAADDAHAGCSVGKKPKAKPR